MLAKLKSRTVPTATNTLLLNNKTPAQIQAGVTSTAIGLGSIQNYPTATAPEVIASAVSNRYVSMAGVKALADAKLATLTGNEGDLFFLGDTSFASLIPGRSLSYLGVVTTDAEATATQSVTESMGDVFNSWKKISRGHWADPTVRVAAGFSDSAVQSDLDGFSYDAATGKIVNAADTHSLVGFISPYAYDNYVLDVILRSDSIWQNDPIGLIVGYVQDLDGTTHALSIMRNPWFPSYGTYGAVDVVVDYNTVGQTFIKTQRANLHWVDGSDAAGPMTVTSSMWSVKPWNLAPNGCRLRVTRAGDTFTVETTEYDSPVFVPAATFTFTLNDNPALARFKGPTRYGYAAISQDQVVWDVQTRPGARQAIADIRNKQVKEWNGTAWVVNPTGWASYIKANRFYYNRATKKLFYADNDSTLLPIL